MCCKRDDMIRDPTSNYCGHDRFSMPVLRRYVQSVGAHLAIRKSDPCPHCAPTACTYTDHTGVHMRSTVKAGPRDPIITTAYTFTGSLARLLFLLLQTRALESYCQVEFSTSHSLSSSRSKKQPITSNFRLMVLNSAGQSSLPPI